MFICVSGLWAQTTGPENGALYIHGGGRFNTGEFVDLVKEHTQKAQPVIRVITTPRGPRRQARREKGEIWRMVTALTRFGLTDVSEFYTLSRDEADSSAFYGEIDRADAIFMSGGNQSYLTDTFLDTETLAAMHRLLERGGVIGGSSAGAQVQSSFMTRGDYLKREILGDKKHQQGFDFVTNSAFDVHVEERNRENDLFQVFEAKKSQLQQRNLDTSQLLGIGIDQGTAITVIKNHLRVSGTGIVRIFDPLHWEGKEPFYHDLKSGAIFDLSTRKKPPATLADNRPNILYILADDLGFSDLGSFGGEIETPNLDALARGGVRLTQLYNTGRCCPSRAALLTGQYPHRVGLGHMTGNDLGQPGYRGVVSADAQTIAQVLSPAGYRSFMSGKWHLGTPDPTQHGFEEFYGTLVSAKRFFDPEHLIRLPADRTARQYPAGQFYATDAVTDHALDFLELACETPAQPWFLYLAYNAPHFPLHAPPADIAKYADRYHGGWDQIRAERLTRMKQLGIVPEYTQLSPRSQWRNYGETETGVNPAWDTLPKNRRLDLARRMAIYAAMIDRLDQQIGRVIDDLKRAGEFENTLIVFTSDNGACFEWDPFGFDIVSSNQNILHEDEMIENMGSAGTFHSVGSAWANASNSPWRLYKHFNHEGGIASPGVVHWPAGLDVPAGSVIHEPAHIIDLLPTAIAAAGTRYDGELDLPGTDLIAQLNEGGNERSLFFEHQGNRAVRVGTWKLVALDDEPWELYDFTTDRTEMNNLASERPLLVDQLSDVWDHWAEQNHVTPLPRDLKVRYLKPD